MYLLTASGKYVCVIVVGRVKSINAVTSVIYGSRSVDIELKKL